MRRFFLAAVAALSITASAPTVASAEPYTVFLREIGTPASTALLANQHAALYGGQVTRVFGALGGYAIDLPAERNARTLSSDPSVRLVSVDQTYRTVITSSRQPPRVAPLRTLTPCVDPPVNESPPTISGSMTLGSVLTGYAGNWDLDGDGCITRYRVTWQKFTANDVFVQNTRTANLIPPNKYDSYRLRPEDTGYKYRVEVTTYIECCATTAYSAFTTTSTPSCTGAQTVPTGADRIEADLSSQVSGDCQGTHPAIIAVLDSGVSLHTDLNIVASNQRNCTDEQNATDSTGHGTSVAGIIAARDNGEGVVGVSPGAMIVSEKVINNIGDSRDSWAICGLDDASATRIDGVPTNDVWVANMSFGLHGPLDEADCSVTTDALHLAVCRARDRGLMVVAAAGNSSRDYGTPWLDCQDVPCVRGVPRPAAFNEVLTVTSMTDYNGIGGGSAASTCGEGVDPDDRYTGASNWATNPADQSHTIAAPGDCIRTTANGGGYRLFSGTSASAPHVAGVVAVCLWGVNNNWGVCSGQSPAGIIAQVRSDAQSYSAVDARYRFTGDPLTPVSVRYYGYLVAADPY